MLFCLIRIVIENGLKIVEDSLGNFTQTLTDIVADMEEYFDYITEANFYRSIAYIVIAVLVLIIALTSLLGVFIPHRKCALVWLKSSVGLGFIWSAIFMAIVSQYLNYFIKFVSRSWSPLSLVVLPIVMLVNHLSHTPISVILKAYRCIYYCNDQRYNIY